MDATNNPLPDHHVIRFPTLKFFRKGSNKGVDTYNGDLSVKQIHNFVDRQVKST